VAPTICMCYIVENVYMVGVSIPSSYTIKTMYTHADSITLAVLKKWFAELRYSYFEHICLYQVMGVLCVTSMHCATCFKQEIEATCKWIMDTNKQKPGL